MAPQHSRGRHISADKEGHRPGPEDAGYRDFRGSIETQGDLDIQSMEVGMGRDAVTDRFSCPTIQSRDKDIIPSGSAGDLRDKGPQPFRRARDGLHRPIAARSLVSFRQHPSSTTPNPWQATRGELGFRMNFISMTASKMTSAPPLRWRRRLPGPPRCDITRSD